jgi:hypothetical protein
VLTVEGASSLGLLESQRFRESQPNARQSLSRVLIFGSVAPYSSFCTDFYESSKSSRPSWRKPRFSRRTRTRRARRRWNSGRSKSPDAHESTSRCTPTVVVLSLLSCDFRRGGSEVQFAAGRCSPLRSTWTTSWRVAGADRASPSGPSESLAPRPLCSRFPAST